jgi:hypothetical protein
MSQIDRACPDFIGGGKDKASCSALSTQRFDIKPEENSLNQLQKTIDCFLLLTFSLTNLLQPLCIKLWSCLPYPTEYSKNNTDPVFYNSSSFFTFSNVILQTNN